MKQQEVPQAWAAGTWLRLARESKGLSARSLSRKAGLSESYVTKLEAGQLEPSFSAFSRIAVVLELSPQEVFVCVVQEQLSHQSNKTVTPLSRV